jgi:hypothetical protein
VFAVFGIEDETVVNVQKVSIPVLAEDAEKFVRAPLTKTILGMQENGLGFYKNYQAQHNQYKSQLATYFNYAANGPFVYGLPNIVISGTELDFESIENALDTDLGFDAIRLSSNATIPPEDVWFKHQMQSAPYLYKPHTDQLTHTAANGVDYDDWSFTDVTFNASTLDYNVTVSRVAKVAYFWIETEAIGLSGYNINAIIRCNRTVPEGFGVRVNLVYSGATNGVEFMASSSVVISSGESVSFVPIAVRHIDVTKTLKIEIEIDANSAFEHVALLPGQESSLVELVPTDGKTLSIPFVTVTEGNDAYVPVILQNSTGSGFTVDYETVDLDDAIPGADFVPSSGTIAFAGNRGEIQNIVLSTLTDLVAEQPEDFGVRLSNCSDPSVVIGNQGVIRIFSSTGVDTSPGNELIKDVISFPNFVKETYVIARYHSAIADASEWYYWLYRVDDGTYPDVSPHASHIANLEMLPVGIVRKNKQFVSQPISEDPANFSEDFGTDTDVYKTTRNLLKRINLDIGDVIDAVADNPDIELIDDAYINFAINPNDNVPALSKILWNQFYDIIVKYGITSNENKYKATFEEQDVNNALVWSNHSHTTNHAITSSHPTLGFLNTAFTDTKIGTFGHVIEGKHLYLFKKVSATNADVIELQHPASMSSISYDGYSNVSYQKLGDEAFTIPVSWHLMKSMQGKEIIEAFPHMFRMDMYAIEVTHLDWYKTEAFSDVFKAILIIITLITLFTAPNLTTAVYRAASGYLVAEVAQYIAEATGNEELALAVAIITAVILGNEFGISFDVTTLEGLTNIVTTFSNSLSGVQEGVLSELKNDLDDLIAEFEEQKKAQDAADVYALPIGGIEYWSLLSPSTQLHMGQGLQFDFDALYDYDNLVANYFDNQLTTGLI